GSAVYFFNEALKGYSEEYIEQNNPILKMFEKAIPLCMSTQDYIRMVEESKNAGSVEALLYRGDIDFLGEEHDISPRSAVKSWELAKNKGIVQAQSRLAAVLWHGYGCHRNFQEAIRLYTEAAKQGDPVANYSLGLIRFRQGKGSSYAEGLRLMKAAAKSNYGPAMTAVGVMALSHNYENSQKIVVAAADIFKQAYECGDSTGGILYALMLLSGTGIPKDTTTGFAILYDLKSRSVKAVDALLKYYTYTSTNESNRIFSQAIELCKAMYLGNVCFSEGAPEAKIYLAKDKKNAELSYFVSIKDEKIFMTDDLRSFLGRNYVRILDDPKDLTIRGKPLVYPELYEILEMYNPTSGAKPFMPNMVLSINASVPPLPRAYDKYNLDLSLIDSKL
ncbi:MAG: tetratricopeptide repeat protein, partial [Succinivibrio sp.]